MKEPYINLTYLQQQFYRDCKLYHKYKEAKWFEKLDDEKVRCFLCPRKCVISDEKNGFCGVRKNVDGELYSLAYGFPIALQVDPIEKKPLAEFMKGTRTFSLGTYGCNLDCVFCQNHNLSRGFYNEKQAGEYVAPELIVQLALKHDCKSVAFTYNEPTIFAEYCVDIAVKAKEQGLATVLVSNGYITPEAAKDLYPLIDAANIDMKGFSEDFYSNLTGAHLQPILDSIKYFHSLGNHLELTNLIIPGENDSEKMINDYFDWVEKNLDKNIPLHFSAYHPDYKYNKASRTSPEILYKIREAANARGFEHVYLGNIL